jgi:hypothetical protein
MSIRNPTDPSHPYTVTDLSDTPRARQQTVWGRRLRPAMCLRAAIFTLQTPGLAVSLFAPRQSPDGAASHSTSA